MAELRIDLDAYVIPDDHRVYKCFPGRAYRFYELMRDEGAVFLDIQGLEALDSDARRWTNMQLLNTIRADRQGREANDVARGRRVPERTGYSKDGFSRTDRRDRTYAAGLYQETKKGDLIVVPAEGYMRDVLIGELLDDPDKLKRIEAT